jgi:hypothetical protein
VAAGGAAVGGALLLLGAGAVSAACVCVCSSLVRTYTLQLL